MARKVDLNPDHKKTLEEVGEEIVSALKGEFFEVDGTPMATVKYENGAFKKKPLLPTWLFQLEYAYVGAMGRIQFGLSPEDAQEYKFVEMHPKEVDDAFPMMGAAVAKHFNLEGENLKILIDTLVAQRLDAKANAAELERKQTEMALQNNELFGAF